MDLQDYPTASQRKTIWAAVTALSTVTIGAIGVGAIWLISTVLGFLQPILIPFAIAGVIAYLLDPIVSKIVLWGTSRQRAVLGVFTVFSLALAGALVWLIPAIWIQMAHVVRKVPDYRARIIQNVNSFNIWARSLERKYGVRVIPQIPEKIEGLQIPPDTKLKSATQGDDPAALKEVPEATLPAPETPPAPTVESTAETSPSTPQTPTSARSPPPGPDTIFDLNQFLKGDWARTTLPGILKSVGNFIRSSVGGFLGVFGFLLSMIIVPIYLYYFLIESKNISEYWGDYLPLRASALKDEVVSVLGEINGYLIAFFRGQLLVSMINGTATGFGLVFVGLDFGILIGVIMCFMGLIPYLGITLCWIPAVIIASVQDGSWLVPAGAAWWVFPLIVTGIFVAVQQVDGLFITPKIVGESVGLHPMTVIVSVFVWSLLMGGLLGAILAVPMTATVKVLLRRYVWERRFRANNAAVTEEQFSELQARSGTPEVSSVSGE